jgi:hypothetical protein
MTIPLEFEEGVGVLISTEAPEGEPYQIVQYTITAFDLNVIINGYNYTIPIPVTIVCSEENGSFATTIPITTVTQTEKYSGDKLTVKFSVNLLFCLTPIPPMTWVNVQVVCTITEEIDGVNESICFTCACPLIPPPE